MATTDRGDADLQAWAERLDRRFQTEADFRERATADLPALLRAEGVAEEVIAHLRVGPRGSQAGEVSGYMRPLLAVPPSPEQANAELGIITC